MTVKTEKEKERLSLFEHSWDVPGNVQVCVCACVWMVLQVQSEVESLKRKLRLVEDDLEQSQSRLQDSQQQLLDTSNLADETDRSLTV